MERRLYIQKTAPAAFQAMFALESYTRKTMHADPVLLALMKMRASQINGCAFCIDMHSKEARAHGETEQRLYALSAWEDTPFFTDRERAALAWTEAITLITEGYALDSVYEQVRQHFSEEELVDLTLALVTINGWNRLNIAFRAQPGEYQSNGAANTAAVASASVPSEQVAR